MWCDGRGLRAVRSVQLGLRVAESCGVVAPVRAVICRDGGPERWSCCGRRPCVVWKMRLRSGGVVVAQLLEGSASSFAFERPVAAPPIAVTASSLRHWRRVVGSYQSGVFRVELLGLWVGLSLWRVWAWPRVVVVWF